MDDSFRVRVDKVFGSLGTETPSSDPSLWCLTDQEIERRLWNRPNKEDEDEEDDDDDQEEEEEGVKSGPSDLANQGESGLLLQQLSESNHEDEDGAEEITKKDKGVVDVSPKTIVDGEDWDIESNIGRDCTLDYEEEEDVYDKVAAGMEQIGDRLYMKDVKFGDYETHELNTYGELPTSYEAVVRDPRANHMAAKIRLKEDADTAGNFDTLQLSDNSEMNLKVGHLDDVDNPKPILKKRETSVESRSQKRVRFMLDDCEEQQQPVNGLASEMTSSLVNDGAMPKQPSRQFYDVPDYVKNPSKYTHYTFDSCGDDMDDQSNRRAFAELFHQLRGGREKEENSSSVDIPKSIVFTPKRKQEQPKGCKENSEGDFKKKGLPVGVTAEESQDVMEEDEPCLPPKKTQKPDRQYRARTNPIPSVDENIDLDVD